MTNTKNLGQSLDLKAMPIDYDPTSSKLQDAISTIDYAMLTSGTPDQRSKVVKQLGKACEEWGCFMLINHGVPETLIKKMMDASNEFFNLTEEEKLEFAANGVLDPIRCSAGFHGVDKNKVVLWREYLRLIVHPKFHCPHKPAGFSELAADYVKRTRRVAMELVKGVSESLGFEASYMNKELNLDSGFQLLAINYYPGCPDPDLSRGLAQHTDHGLLTLLYENGVQGLEVLHKGKWIELEDVPNAFSVLTSDHLEIFSNGKYKSNWHRAVVKDKAKRITLVNPNGPSLDTIVGPSSRLVDGDDQPPAYLPMKYSEYLEMQTELTIQGKHAFDKVRLHV